METILTALIAQFKNPWQYICLGVSWLCILIFKINLNYLFPLLLLSLATGCILSNLSCWALSKYRQHQRKKEILFSLTHLNTYEKEFIKSCLKNNVQTKVVDAFRGGIISSLQAKSIAFVPSGINNINSIPLTISNNVWKIIQKNKGVIFENGNSKNNRKKLVWWEKLKKSFFVFC